LRERTELLERDFAGPAYSDRDLVLADELGGPINPQGLTESFAEHRKAAGIPTATLHTLRHTAATLALTAGVTVPIAAARLGDGIGEAYRVGGFGAPIGGSGPVGAVPRSSPPSPRAQLR
jgi:hypothetical protein